MSQLSLNSLLGQMGPANVTGFFLVLARITPLFILAPLFSSKMVPARVKTVVALGLAIGLSPVAGPMMLVGLVIGLVVSIFQAVTSIQEQSLTFIPKIAGLAAVIVILGPWMLDQLVTYATNLYTSIPSLIS